MKKKTKIKYPAADWAIDQLVRETGLVEDICEHGIGHPNEEYMKKHDPDSKKCLGVHGCDGCCDPDRKFGDQCEGPLPDISNKITSELKEGTEKKQKFELMKLEADSLRKDVMLLQKDIQLCQLTIEKVTGQFQEKRALLIALQKELKEKFGIDVQ